MATRLQFHHARHWSARYISEEHSTSASPSGRRSIFRPVARPPARGCTSAAAVPKPRQPHSPPTAHWPEDCRASQHGLTPCAAKQIDISRWSHVANWPAVYVTHERHAPLLNPAMRNTVANLLLPANGFKLHQLICRYKVCKVDRRQEADRPTCQMRSRGQREPTAAQASLT